MSIVSEGGGDISIVHFILAMYYIILYKSGYSVIILLLPSMKIDEVSLRLTPGPYLVTVLVVLNSGSYVSY